MSNIEMAVSVIDQQKAALHAIAIGMLDIGNVHNKKSVKKLAKKLKREVLQSVGKSGGTDIINGNVDAVTSVLKGFRAADHLTKAQIHQVIKSTAEGWQESFYLGVNKIYG